MDAKGRPEASRQHTSGCVENTTADNAYINRFMAGKTRPCALRQRHDGCFSALSPPVGCKGTCKRQRMRLFARRAVRFVCPRFFGRPTGMNFVFIRAGRKRLGRVTLLGSRLLRMASAFGIRISLFAPVFAESNRALLNCTAYAFGSRHTHRKFAAKQRNCLYLWISRFNRMF